MRASIKFNSILISSLMLAASMADAAPAQAQAQKAAAKSATAAQVAAEQDDNAVNAFIVQKLLASIKRSGCDFEFEGSINGEESSLDSLNVDCTVQLTDKHDLNFAIGQTEESKKQDGFNTVVNIKSKALYLRLLGQKDNGTMTLTARFYSGYDKVKKVWLEKPLEVGVAVMNGDQVMNAELVAVRLSGIDLRVQQNPKNTAELGVVGSCKSEKKIFDFVSNTFVYRPANCFLEGVYEPNKTSKFKFGFKNAGVKATLP